jgi:fatty-acid peroxygenase
MASIPKKSMLIATDLVHDGYRFLQNKFRRYKTNIFKINIPFAPVVCVTGADAAEVFYDTSKFMRKGSVPKRIQRNFMGENGIQTLDGQKHRHRKEMFMSFMTPEHLQELHNIIDHLLRARLPVWEQQKRVVLFDEMQELLCRAACSWTGMPLRENEVRQRAKDFAAMVDAFGSLGIARHLRGKRARRRAEAWIGNVVNKIRSGHFNILSRKPLYTIATFKDVNGQLLPVKTVAVELINVIRPIVAISYYIVFSALAMYQFPETGEKLRQDEDEYLQLFIQEVRRFYPFAPFLAAVVSHDFDWRDYHFTRGTKVFLDVYGINHDPHTYETPELFIPERFKDWDGSPFNFIPHGGGDYKTGHRCAGEWLTIDVMKAVVQFLAKGITYAVPQEQDLSYPLSRIPTYPKSGFVMEDVRRVD